MTSLPDTCDFCNLIPEDDESLVEVRFGSQPQPDLIRVEARDSQYRNETNKLAQGRVLIEELRGNPLFDVTTHDFVEEVRSVGPVNSSSNQQFQSLGNTENHGTVHEDMVAVRLKVYPEATEVEADAMLCQHCADMLQG